MDDRNADCIRDAFALVSCTLAGDHEGLHAILTGMTDDGARGAASSLAGLLSGLLKANFEDPAAHLDHIARTWVCS